jgi:hypothetical protein
LQDQMGFEGVLNQEFFNEDKKPLCGNWAYPVYPSARCLQGSPPTPYIFADYINYNDAAEGINYWYNLKNKNIDKFNTYGMNGRKYLIENGHTFNNMINSFDNILNLISKEWKPRQRIYIEKC